MSEYTDTTLLNCNRSASVQARSKSETNKALFTNSLQQTVQLNVGDKISVERAFISEVGAGNPQTIEFKGQMTGTRIVPPYTSILKGDYYYKRSNTYNVNYRLGNYRSISTEVIDTEEFQLRDNLAPLIIGYYITSNEYPNYIQQPRCFTQNQDDRSNISIMVKSDFYPQNDSVALGFPKFTIDDDCFVEDDWVARASGVGNDFLFKQKVDNSRYTLFVNDLIVYSKDVANYFNQFPRTHNGIISERKYMRVREKLMIEVNKGFNTPSAVSKQITAQLNETKNETIFNILDGTDFIRPITKTIENSTFKPIDCQSMYNFGTQTQLSYEETDFSTGAAPQDAVDYISTFGYIAVKRPEIFETGRIMGDTLVPNTTVLRDLAGNIIVGLRPFGDEGFQLYEQVNQVAGFLNTMSPLISNIEYNPTNLEIIRDFLDTQAYYPELFSGLPNTNCYSDVRTGNTTGANTITEKNSRFLHVNKYALSQANTRWNEGFGQDNYVERTGANDVNMTTLPVFMQWNPDNYYKYVEPESWVEADGLIYGFAKPVLHLQFDGVGVPPKKIYLIKFSTEFTGGRQGGGGIPDELFTNGNAYLEVGRIFGYDYHATAYSTAIITPFSGYSNRDMGTRVDGAIGTVNRPDGTNMMLNLGAAGNGTDISPYQTQTYVGANNPELAFNGINNRFEFKRLHTGNNVGNLRKAGCQLNNTNSDTMIPDPFLALEPPLKNADAADTVYKINPRPRAFGFSPTFLPYINGNQAYQQGVYPAAATADLTKAPNTQFIQRDNINIEPFEIFDSHGGIYIDNFGIGADDWENNLWNILGFDNNAISAPPSALNVLTQRITNTNADKLYRPTTNAEIVATDGKAYVTNRYGANMYYTSLPYPLSIIGYAKVAHGGSFVFDPLTGSTAGARTFNPEIVVKTISTSITATDLQKSVLKPYYTIRSSLLEGVTSIGGNPTGADLPIISIIDKYSASSDYFLGNPSDLEFTITRNTTVADITTSIHDPDGELSNVNGTSAVIYKIQKLKPAPVNLIDELLKQNKKK